MYVPGPCAPRLSVAAPKRPERTRKGGISMPKKPRPVKKEEKDKSVKKEKREI